MLRTPNKSLQKIRRNFKIALFQFMSTLCVSACRLEYYTKS
jgi:hypothetical protein